MTEKKQNVNRSTLATIAMIIFSLLCALLIWVYVTETNGADYSKTCYGVKVVFEGENLMRESRGLIISETYVTSVKVELSGSRRVVAGLDPADLLAVIDLSGISRTGNYELAPKIVYPNRVDTSQITAAAIVPGTINFYVDKLSVRSVPVEGVFNGSAAKGFTAEPLQFDTETIRIYGPENVISKVERALVEVGRTEVDKSLTFETTYVLKDAEGETFESDEITFDRETVIVTLPVNAIKDVDLVVDLVAGGGATKDNVMVKVEPSSITLIGDSETLAGVNTISLAKIELAKLEGAMTESYKIVIPNNTYITNAVKEATVTLTLEGLAQKTVTIDKSNISIINNSEGYVSEVMNNALEDVIIRGPAEALRDISDVNVRAIADLKDYGTATGFLSVPVRIEIDGSSVVGAIGEYKAFINVTEGNNTPGHE